MVPLTYLAYATIILVAFVLPIALALIITVLVLKPAGLFGRPIVKRVWS